MVKISHCVFWALAALAARATPSGARLYQVPINTTTRGTTNHRRSLTGGSDIDLDNLYQARGVQYADLKVGMCGFFFCVWSF